MYFLCVILYRATCNCAMIFTVYVPKLHLTDSISLNYSIRSYLLDCCLRRLFGCLLCQADIDYCIFLHSFSFFFALLFFLFNIIFVVVVSIDCYLIRLANQFWQQCNYLAAIRCLLTFRLIRSFQDIFVKIGIIQNHSNIVFLIIDI